MEEHQLPNLQDFVQDETARFKQVDHSSRKQTERQLLNSSIGKSGLDQYEMKHVAIDPDELSMSVTQDLQFTSMQLYELSLLEERKAKLQNKIEEMGEQVKDGN